MGTDRDIQIIAPIGNNATTPTADKIIFSILSHLPFKKIQKLFKNIKKIKNRNKILLI